MILEKIQIWGLLIILLLGISCNNHKTETYINKEEIYTPEYSQNFKIEGLENSKNILITVFNPWQGSKDVSTQLLIIKDSIVPDDFHGQVLMDKAKKIVCMSSTHIAMLDVLDALNSVVGVSGLEYVSNPKINASSTLTPDVGYEGNIDYETLISINPDLVLLFSVNGASTMEPKLQELKIPYLYIGDYLEEEPLGKSEWIIPIAEVIGEREKGKEIFNSIVDKYENLKSKVKIAEEERPKIMVNAPFVDSWFMPSTQSYVARMINDAGGEYIYKKNTGNSSKPIDMEEALLLVSQADYWINIGSVRSLEEFKNSFPNFLEADCVVKGNLYNNNLRSSIEGGNDCYESGVVNPDLILKDMIKIFHPSLIDEEFTYYQKLE